MDYGTNVEKSGVNEVDGTFLPDRVEQHNLDAPYVGTEDEQGKEIDAQPFAKDAELVKKAKEIIVKKYNQYKNNRSDFETFLRDADYMWKCGRNTSLVDAKTNQNDDDDESTTHAKTGSTLFWRQSKLLTIQTLSVAFSKDDFFRYSPIKSTGYFEKIEEGQSQANQWTDVVRWNRKQDDWDLKLIEGSTLLNKYGNQPIVYFWKQRIDKRKEKRPVRGVPTEEGGVGPVVEFILEENERLVENYGTIRFWDNKDFFADQNIGDIQKQSCVLLRSLTSYNDLYCEQADGQITNVETLTAGEIYRGEHEDNLHAQRQENIDQNALDDTQTGQFERWDVFVRLPIDASGRWDEKKNKPDLYWLTFIGGMNGDCRCVRFERNPDPDDEIPVLMWHQFPDDPDRLYHIAGAQIIMGNFDELTTSKNQAIDNRTLNVRRPLIVVNGGVHSDDLSYRQDNVFYVDSQGDVQEMDVADMTGTIMSNIQYLEDDANRALSTDKPIEGAPLGSRTSASEATNVYEQAKMPHLINARYQLSQIFNWIGRKTKRYWEFFAHPDQVIELTGKDQRREIKPYQLYGDYEVEVDVVDDMAADALRTESINYAMNQLMSNPSVTPYIEIPELLKEWSQLNKLKNPKWIKKSIDTDSERLAEMENEIMLDIDNPRYIPPEPTQNHERHLQIHKARKQMYKNIPNAKEQFPGLPLLDQHIAETESLMAQSQAAAMPMGANTAPQNIQAPPENQTIGEAAANPMAGMMGAMTPQ